MFAHIIQLSTTTLLLVFSAFGIFSGIALGQSVPAFEEIVVTGKRINPESRLDRPAVVASGLDLTVRDMPASIDIIDLSRNNRVGASTLAEATRGATGLTFTTRSGAPGVFSARGFTENAIVTLYDGVRVQSATVTARPYDPFNFERIEVLRGPASLVYGEGATAGAVNYVRRKPRLGALSGDAFVEGGSFDHWRVGAAISGGLTDDVGAVVSGSYRDAGSFVDGVQTKSLHVVGGVGANIGKSGQILIEADYLDNETDNAYWGAPVVAGQVDHRLRKKNYNSSPTNLMDDNVLWLRGVFQNDFSDALSYRGQVYSYEADRDWRNFYAFLHLPGAMEQVEVRNVENLGYDHELWGTRHDLNARYDLGAMNAQTVMSFEYSDTDFSSPRRDGAPVQGAAFRPRFSALNPQPVDFNTLTGPRLKQREANVAPKGLSLEQKIDLTTTVTFVGGARRTWIEATVARPESTPAVAPFDVDLKATDWRASFTWKPVQSQTLYAAYTSGNEPVESLLLLPLTQANFKLAKSNGFELGWKAQLLNNALDVQSSIYRLVKTRLPSINPTNPNLAPQVGEQASKGIEAGVSYARDDWRFNVNASYTNAEYKQFNDFGAFRDGVRPANVPKWIMNASADYRVIEPVVVGATAQYVSARPSNNANVLFLKGYTTLGAFIEWRVVNDVTLTVRAQNLSDEKYVEWATQTFGQNNLYFGNPRRIEFTLSGRF